MDFKSFKDKAIKFKNETIDSAAKKLSESSLVIKTKEDLDKHIAKSKNTSFKSNETGETKTFTKHSIVIFVKKDSEFYKDALIQVPVLATKAWSKSTSLKMSDIDEKIVLEAYWIVETPCLVLFTDTKVSKLVVWEESIKTIVKTLDLDIIKAIENI